MLASAARAYRMCGSSLLSFTVKLLSGVFVSLWLECVMDSELGALGLAGFSFFGAAWLEGGFPGVAKAVLSHLSELQTQDAVSALNLVDTVEH